MISTNQFKIGMTIRFEGDIYRIAEYQHVKPGKGGAFVRTKLRNVSTGLPCRTDVPARGEVRAAAHREPADAVSVRRARSGRLHGRRVLRATRPSQERPRGPPRPDDAQHGSERRLHRRRAVRRRTPHLRRSEGRRYRCRRQGQHRVRRLQGGRARDRRDDQCAALHRTGRRHPHRHAHPGVCRPGRKEAA